jgi:hypothetical protein
LYYIALLLVPRSTLGWPSIFGDESEGIRFAIKKIWVDKALISGSIREITRRSRSPQLLSIDAVKNALIRANEPVTSLLPQKAVEFEIYKRIARRNVAFSSCSIDDESLSLSILVTCQCYSYPRNVTHCG